MSRTGTTVAPRPAVEIERDVNAGLRAVSASRAPTPSSGVGDRSPKRPPRRHSPLALCLAALAVVGPACSDTVETRYVDTAPSATQTAGAGGAPAVSPAEPKRLVPTFPQGAYYTPVTFAAVGSTMFFTTEDSDTSRYTVESVSTSGVQKTLVNQEFVRAVCPSAAGVFYFATDGNGKDHLWRVGATANRMYDEILSCSMRAGYGVVVATLLSGEKQTQLISSDLSVAAPLRVLQPALAGVVVMASSYALVWSDGELRAFPVAGGDPVPFGATPSCFGVHQGRVVWPGTTGIESRELPGEPVEPTSLDDGCVKIDNDGAWYVDKARQALVRWSPGAAKPVELLNHQYGIDRLFVDDQRIYWNSMGDVWAWDKPRP